MREQLEQLVETWQARSESLTRAGVEAEHTQDGRWWAGEAEGRAKCADELAALLRSAPPEFAGSAEEAMEAAVAADYAPSAPVTAGPGATWVRPPRVVATCAAAEDHDRFLAAKDAELARWEEREAACCPEDVGFEEHIAVLRARADRAEAALAESRADWQRLGDLLRMDSSDPPFLIGAVQAMQHSEAESRQDLALNATMLARQCDLARDAEAEVERLRAKT